MMKSPEDRLSIKLAEPVDRPTARRILVQRQMCSAFVVIAGVGRKDPTKIGLAEDDVAELVTQQLLQTHTDEQMIVDNQDR